ncbi:MAG: IS1634 family transposase [Candidatus Methanomethylophilaceae archaeon]|nr:IS1634 family transposase [Candidatus Methanomethylophilaceae archaeon]MDY0246910.1 IS1634 family transposase [Methanosarcina mazei]
MGSIFYMERNGQKYAYESTSVRVPGKKNPRTVKTYLGKVDPETGRIIPKESRKRPDEEYAKFYGTVHALDGIQKKMGLFEDLDSVFIGMAPNIVGAAIALTINPTSMDSIHYTVEGSVIKEKLKLRGALSPSTVGELSEKVGSMISTMDRFFMKRISRSSSEFYSLDLTSVSTYSKMQGWAQWGHNRDNEDLKQTNIAMVTDADGIPVMFRMLPGSIADMAVMQTTVDDMRRLGCYGRLVMDRGFESAENISKLLDLGVDFTMPSNARAEPIKKLMSMAVSDMGNSSAFRFHEDRAYKAIEYEVGVPDIDGNAEYIIRVPQNQKNSTEINRLFETSRKLKAFVVFDPTKAADDMNSMMSMINETELRLENTKQKDPGAMYRGLHPHIRRYLDYSVDDDGMMHIHRKTNAMTFADNRAGMFVMLSSENTTWEQMMSSYDVRDWVEKAFDVYKNDLDGNRTRTGNEERARGRLFIKFIALIMRIRIQNMLRDHDRDVLSTGEKKDSVNGMTVDEVLLSLNTLMAIGNTGDWRLTAVTRNVREIFRLFGLEEPKSGQIILS